jgi:hypothetical protein
VGISDAFFVHARTLFWGTFRLRQTVSEVAKTESLGGDVGELISNIERAIKTIGEVGGEVSKEVYISGRIEQDQFGFTLSEELVSLLARHQYRLAFSGIVFLEE